MIQKIEHTISEHSQDIRRVFQVSYKIEAALLGANNFPPLSRPIEAFLNSKNDFIGFYEDGKLVAVVEMKDECDSMHIQSLVVHPDFFRRGIARRLVALVLEHYSVSKFTVETGGKNLPARKLYESFGFRLLKTYTADEGIVKVRYTL